MRLGIDASNLRAGGGINHLAQMLEAAEPAAHGFDTVVVWASRATLGCLKDQPWLLKRHEPALESSYLRRAWWQAMRLGTLARREQCDLLFIPGGAFATEFRPLVTMSRNMLPFEWRELWRYGFSLTTLRLLLLRKSQTRSFRNASGTIFLTRYAKRVVLSVTGPLNGASEIIPHGVDASFYGTGRAQGSLEKFSPGDPLRVVYVSIVDMYKHQWHVASAVAELRGEGFPISLTLIGPAYRRALRRLQRVMGQLDPRGEYIHYTGVVPHAELPARYAAADLCVFASSCENMPNILVEGMAAELPIACSDRGCMPEILGDAGCYFDPEDPASISRALRELIGSAELRERRAHAARERARELSWTRCARETFSFLARVAASERGSLIVST